MLLSRTHAGSTGRSQTAHVSHGVVGIGKQVRVQYRIAAGVEDTFLDEIVESMRFECQTFSESDSAKCPVAWRARFAQEVGGAIAEVHGLGGRSVPGGRTSTSGNVRG